MKFFFLFLVSFLMLSVSFAQNDTTALLNEFKRLNADNLVHRRDSEKMQVVSASRSSKVIEDLPVTIHVITGEEIRRNGYTTLIDALKSVPGIRTSKLGSGDLGEMFLMRGLVGNSYCKILINNVPIQPVVTGSLAVGEQLPVAQAQQIEVVYGPASAVYGADAMAGVINIIMKKPTDSEFAHINFSQGQQGYRNFNFMAGGKIGKNKNVLSYTLFGNQGKRDDLNFNKTGENFNAVNYVQSFFKEFDDATFQQFQQLDDDVFLSLIKSVVPHYQGALRTTQINELPQRSYMVGTNFNYRNFELSIIETYRQDHSSIGKMPIVYSYANPNTFIGENIQRMTLSYSNHINKLNFQGNLSYLRYQMNPNSALATNYENGFGGKSYIYQASDDIFGEFVTNYQMNEHWELTAGASMIHSGSLPTINEQGSPFEPSHYKKFDSTHRAEPQKYLEGFGYYPTLRTNIGAFVQAYWTWRRWTGIFGIRYDQTLGFQTNNYGRFGALYKLTGNSSLRFSAAAAVRAPTPDEQYISLAVPHTWNNPETGLEELEGVAYQRIPNPDLKPEILETFEFGYRRRFSPKFDMEAIAQFQLVKQLIVGQDVLVDKSVYPHAISENEEDTLNLNPQARQFYNDEKSYSNLIELQLLLRGRKLTALELDVDLFVKIAGGEENLPQEEGKIDGAKMVPVGMAQFNISTNPKKNLYFRIESQLLSSWTRRYVADIERHNKDQYAQIPGYFNVDLMTSYKLNRNLDLYFRVLNVFDAEYGGLGSSGLEVDLQYNPQLRRNIYFGINFNLN